MLVLTQLLSNASLMVTSIVGFTATVALARFIVAEHEDSDIGRPRPGGSIGAPITAQIEEEPS